MLPENQLQLYLVGVALKGILITNNVVICHHSLRMDEPYYNVIYGFVLNGRSIISVYLNAICSQHLCV